MSSTFEPALSQPYLDIRSTYDANFDRADEPTYNRLSGAIYNLKSSNILPDPMYDAVNRMQDNFGKQIGGLESFLG